MAADRGLTMIMVEVELVRTGQRVTLPLSGAEQLAALGVVRLPPPKPDARYRQPAPLTLSDTWRNGTFVPGVPVHY